MRLELAAGTQLAFFAWTAGEEVTVAEQELRSGYEALEQLGERSYLSTSAALLAELVYVQGRHDEAERLASISRDIGSIEDVDTQVGWRVVEGKVLARRGMREEANHLAEEAVRLAAGTDHVKVRALTLIGAAEIYELTDRPKDGVPLLEEAIRLYEQKEAHPFARGARERLKRLRTTVPAG